MNITFVFSGLDWKAVLHIDTDAVLPSTKKD